MRENTDHKNYEYVHFSGSASDRRSSLHKNLTINTCCISPREISLGEEKLTLFRLLCQTRATEHIGISRFTGKRLRNVKHSAISDHQLQVN